MDEVARVGEGLVDLARDYAEMLEVGEATNNTQDYRTEQEARRAVAGR